MKSKGRLTLVGLLLTGLLWAAAVIWLRDNSDLREQEAIERLKQRGFRFTFHEQPPSDLWKFLGRFGVSRKSLTPARSAHFRGDLTSLDDLSDLSDLTALKSFTLIDANESTDLRSVVTDSLLAPLKCDSLEYFVVTARNGLTDRFLARFAGSLEIKSLIVNDSFVTDRGLRFLGGCSNLKYIGLEGCQITNSGVESLVRLPSLYDLALNRTLVDNRVLPILAQSAYVDVELCGTAVSIKEAIAQTKSWPGQLRVGPPNDPISVYSGEAFQLASADGFP